MVGETDKLPLIRTKVYRTRISGNLVPRPRLLERLGQSAVPTMRALTLVNAQHIAASVFINDDERGLHADYEKWLEELAPHAPISQHQHNRTDEVYPERNEGAMRTRT